MKILQSQTVFVITTLFWKLGGTNANLFLWKGCKLQKHLGTYALEDELKADAYIKLIDLKTLTLHLCLVIVLCSVLTKK